MQKIAGFPCDSFNNPPDFFLDVMIECEQSEEAYNAEGSETKRSVISQGEFAGIYGQSVLYGT